MIPMDHNVNILNNMLTMKEIHTQVYLLMFTFPFLIKPWLNLPTGGDDHVICMGVLALIGFTYRIA